VLFALIALGFLFGAFAGSFLNVCAHRLPRGESVVKPGSRCYACGTAVQWYDNVPLVSWLVLGGRCRWCGSGFSIRYWLVEVLVGLITAGLVWWTFGPWFGDVVSAIFFPFNMDPTIPQALALGCLVVVTYALVVSVITDLAHLIIPDEINLPMQLAAPFLALGMRGGYDLAHQHLYRGFHVPLEGNAAAFQFNVWAGLFPWILVIIGAAALLAVSLPVARWVYTHRIKGPFPWREEDHRSFARGAIAYLITLVPALIAIMVAANLMEPANVPYDTWFWVLLVLLNAVLGSLTGWWLLYLIGLIGTAAFGRNALGYGDVKLMAWFGAILGPVGVLGAFFCAALYGTLVGVPARLLGAGREIPFGPYLVLGGATMLIAGPWIVQQVWSLGL
jgi:prepilin signal peptidase PulO-like enzyme (type II secretory pathway)